MFRFADLPPDIALDVLVASANARGLARALRMRLVCKRFSHLVLDAILETDLLDCFEDLDQQDVGVDESNLAHHGTFLYLWRTYLTGNALGHHRRRVTEVGAVLRKSATRYCAEACLSGADTHRAVVEALCHIIVLCGRRGSWFDPPPERWPPAWHTWQGALVAATIFNNAAVAERILTHPRRGGVSIVEGDGKGTHFNNPSYLAVYFGSRDVLRVFRRLSRSEREKYHHGCIVSACSDRKSPENLRALWGEVPMELDDEGVLPSLADITTTAVADMVLTDNPDMVELYRKLSCETWGLPTPALLKDMPERERKELTEDIAVSYKSYVQLAASRGHVRMLQFLLEVVSPFQHSRRKLPVREAASAFHTDAVKWLVRYGADANKGNALGEAVSAGSLEISKILVENGADPRAGHPPPIVRAVQIEHTGIVDLLQKNGALTKKARKQAFEAARDLGLDSMMRLLNSNPL